LACNRQRRHPLQKQRIARRRRFVDSLPGP